MSIDVDAGGRGRAKGATEIVHIFATFCNDCFPDDKDGNDDDDMMTCWWYSHCTVPVSVSPAFLCVRSNLNQFLCQRNICANNPGHRQSPYSKIQIYKNNNSTGQLGVAWIRHFFSSRYRYKGDFSRAIEVGPSKEKKWFLMEQISVFLIKFVPRKVDLAEKTPDLYMNTHEIHSNRFQKIPDFHIHPGLRDVIMRSPGWGTALERDGRWPSTPLGQSSWQLLQLNVFQ